MDEQTSLNKRIIFSLVLILLVGYTVFYSPNWFFFLVVEAFSLIGLYEFYEIAEKKGIFINKFLGLIFGAMLPFSIYFQGESVIILVTILCLFIFNFHRSLKANSLISTAVTVFGIFYIPFLFSFFSKIKHLQDGTAWVAYVLLVTKLGDTGAYFVGTKIGKHLLIPHISPKKTIEGSVANFLTCVAASLASKLFLPNVSWVHLVILGAILGILSQFGDLAESLIKRDAGVKDSGNIPGLGGVLDVMDSVLFTAPFTHYYLTAFLGLKTIL
ncbi:MAG: phosphatidate cytidylyltransferase [Candidatus Omnitrophica bacterium]|nr:phosphatidate cytidylyltransferase [Candidatus Omnitrophota bacterium]